MRGHCLVALSLLVAASLAADDMDTGVCPIPSGKLGTCEHTCEDDQHCDPDSQDGRKCCSNGCGTQCMDEALQVSELTACTATRQMLLTVMEQAGYTAMEDLSVPVGFYIPSCDTDDGSFTLSQCMGSTCWCVDPATGEELGGTRTYEDQPPHDCSTPVATTCPPLDGDCTLTMLTCSYGLALDQNACKLCECYDPCLNFICPGDDEICKPFHVFCTSPPCSALPECVAQGHLNCPPFSDNQDCSKECDEECPADNQQCCSTGCGTKCFASIIQTPAPGSEGCPDPAMIEGPCASHCISGEDTCGDEELCCPNHCGHLECINPQVINQNKALSNCHQRQTEALQQHVDAATATEISRPYIPRCVESGLWEEVQCAESVGLCWCVDSNRTRTTDFVRGHPNCTRAIEKHQLDQSVDVCANSSSKTVADCSPLYLCSMSVCLPHPTAVCRLDPCGGCTARFYDQQNQEVNCLLPELTDCQRRRQSILNNSSRPLDISDFIKSFGDDSDQLAKYIKPESRPLIKGLGGVCGIPSVAADIDPQNFDNDLIKLMSTLGVGQYGVPGEDLSELLDMYGGASSNISLEQLAQLLELFGGGFNGQLFTDTFAGSFDSFFASLFPGSSSLSRRRRGFADWLASLGEEIGDITSDAGDFFTDLLDQFNLGDLSEPSLDGLFQMLQSTIEAMSRAKPLFLQYVPTCNAQGDYDWMQCHGNSGVCWCVDKDGVPKPDTVTTMSSTNFLQCNQDGRVADTGGQPEDLLILCGMQDSGKKAEELLCLDTKCYREDHPDSNKQQEFCIIDPCKGCKPYTWQDCHRLGDGLPGGPSTPVPPVVIPSKSPPPTPCPGHVPDCSACDNAACPAMPKCAICSNDDKCVCTAVFTDYKGQTISCDGETVGPCVTAATCQAKNKGGFEPNCTTDGTGRYNSTQCNPEANQCWCTNTAGEEIADTRTTATAQTFTITCDHLEVTSFRMSIIFQKDYDKVIKEKEDIEKFIMKFKEHFVETYNGMDEKMITEITVTKGSIVCNFTLKDYTPDDKKTKQVENYHHLIEADVKQGSFKLMFGGEELVADPSSLSSDLDTSPLAKGDASGLSTGAVVAVVIVVLVCVLVIAGAAYVYYQRHSGQGAPGAKYTRDLGKDGEQVAFSNEYHDFPTTQA